MATEIKTGSFCGLSRSEDFQRWLQAIAKDLHADLLTVVKSAKGCRANSNKMMDIYFELNSRGLEPNLITFLKRRFPWVLKEVEKPQKREQLQHIKVEQQLKRKATANNWESLNKHKVFSRYRPDILSFPQKLILTGNPNSLYNKVQEFSKDKLAVDYLIIEDHAYIEYFEMKYAAVIDKIPRENRDIYKYRWKMRHNAE